MHATAVIPIKRFSAAKQRLTDALQPRERATLAEAMFSDVLAAIGESELIDRVLVVSGEPAAEKLAVGAGAEAVFDPDDAGHSAAALLGIAGSGSARCVILLPGDCPLLDPGEIDAELERQGGEAVGVIADRHGTGTNGLILSPPGAIEPSFGPGSCERHLALARAGGLEGRICEIPSMGLDLDTAGDLSELRRALAEGERAPATREALGRIELGAGSRG